MKQGIVKFSKEFVTETGLKEWVGIELPFDAESESAINALRQAETIVREYQRPKSYLMQYENMHPAEKAHSRLVDSGDIEIGITSKDIWSCQDLVTLDSYRLIVKNKGGELETAYNVRRVELVAKESKEILDASKKTQQ